MKENIVNEPTDFLVTIFICFFSLLNNIVRNPILYAM